VSVFSIRACEAKVHKGPALRQPGVKVVSACLKQCESSYEKVLTKRGIEQEPGVGKLTSSFTWMSGMVGLFSALLSSLHCMWKKYQLFEVQ
jgi:hypothetical protein